MIKSKMKEPVELSRSFLH